MTNSITNYKNSYLLCAFVFLFSININAQNSQGLYNAVQNIYSGYSSIGSNDCNAAKRMVAKLQQYAGNRTAVPAAKAYSVNFPKKVNNPTIGDLANDRIARLKSQFKSCFQAGNTSPEDLTLYNKVQNIYVRYSSIGSNDCNAVTDMVAKLQQYTGSRAAVPTSKAYTVSFPKKVTNPNIGDLAKDRIARLKSQFKSCFESKAISNYILENHPGAWKYVHDGREFHFAIDRRGNTVVGSFKKHKYSYPPIYKGVRMERDNRTRFRFELGGTYIVRLEFGQTSSETFAYLSESWNDSGKWVKLNLQPIIAEKPAPTVRITAADVTFLNQTRSSVVIYWVNGNGKEIKYKTLSPGASYVQGTYSTHKWRVRMNGGIYQNYTTTKEKSQLVRIQ